MKILAYQIVKEPVRLPLAQEQRMQEFQLSYRCDDRVMAGLLYLHTGSGFKYLLNTVLIPSY